MEYKLECQEEEWTELQFKEIQCVICGKLGSNSNEFKRSLEGFENTLE